MPVCKSATVTPSVFLRLFSASRTWSAVSHPTLAPPGTLITNRVFGCISFPLCRATLCLGRDGALVEFAGGSDYVKLDRILAPDQPKSRGLFPNHRRILQLSIAVDMRRVPNLRKAERQPAPRHVWDEL